MKKQLCDLLKSLCTLEYSLFCTKTDPVVFDSLFEKVPYLSIAPMDEYSPAVEGAYDYLLRLKTEINAILSERLPEQSLPTGMDSEQFLMAEKILEKVDKMSAKRKLRSIDSSMDLIMDGFTTLHQKREVARSSHPLSLREKASWNKASLLMASFRICLKEDELLKK